MLADELVQLAESQLGVIARWQLLRTTTRGTVDQYVRQGLLVPVQRGVLRIRGGAPLPDQLPIAAALRARPQATITGPYVLSRRRIDGYAADAPFEILTRPTRSLHAAVGFRHRPDPSPSRAVDLLGEVRLATALDALIDSGRFRKQLGDRTLRLAYDSLRWRNELSVAAFQAALARRPADDLGAAAFRDLFGLADLRSESEGERTLGLVVCSFRPAPEPQVWITPRHRPDWLFRALRLAIEYHGSVDHETVRGRRADADRNMELADVDIRVEVVRAADLRDLDALTARLAAVLTLRAKELGVPAPVYVG